MRGHRLGTGWRSVAVAAGVIVALVLARPAVAAGPADDGAQPGDPALSVSPAAVHAAMVCRGPVGGGGREPVLLVHGTFVTADESYGWNYLPELATRGYRVCTVDLPNRSMDDIQVASEYVVVAVHRLARESGRKVDVLGHSQGALEARWAVKWWPSVQAQVDDVVTLAGPNQGTTVSLAPFIPLLGCSACLQMAPDSAFIAALNRDDQTPGAVSYTSIYSTRYDELITPNATAPRIEGASNLELQALCRSRVVTHASILSDAAAFSLVVDALGQPGPATAARFNRASCLRTSFIGLPGTVGALQMLLSPHRAPAPGAVPTVEPPLKPYAQPPAASATVARKAPAATAARTAPAPAPAGRVAAARASAATPAATPVVAVPSVASAPAVALPVEPAASTSPARGGALPLVALLALLGVAGAAGGVTARRAGLLVRR